MEEKCELQYGGDGGQRKQTREEEEEACGLQNGEDGRQMAARLQELECEVRELRLRAEVRVLSKLCIISHVSYLVCCMLRVDKKKIEIVYYIPCIISNVLYVES